nr:hypothetical protein [Tanacetum cinerariifolium]
MADINIPANDAPAEQAPDIAPPTRTDDQILPSSNWVPIGKSNRPSQHPLRFLLSIFSSSGTPCALTHLLGCIAEEFFQSIQTFLTDRTNLATASRGKKKTTHLLIPSVRYIGKDSRETFGMPIPVALLTDEIKGAPYYGEYQEHVAKYQQYLDAVHVKAEEGEAIESSKATKVIKPKAAKVTKPASDPKPKPVPTQPSKVVPEKKQKLVHETLDEPSSIKRSKDGLVRKIHKPLSSLKLVDEPSAEDVPAGPNPGIQDEGQVRPNPSVQDEGRAGLNPGDATESQPQSSHVENLNLPSEDLVIPEEPTSSTGTLFSLENLEKELSFTNQFFVKKQQEKEPRKTNAEVEVQSMVLVPIHQDTSSVPPMTTLVIDHKTSQSGSPLPTSLTATSIVMTTTTIPPPPLQPQQSTTDPTLMKRIDELEQHMVNFLRYNLALEERLDKHRSWLYKLKNLNIPHQVSKAVNKIVTDAVDCAMQAPLRARFSDLLAVDMKEILQQRMFKDKSYEAHEDHKKFNDALEKTPYGSPPPQPPPLPPPAGASGAPGSKAPSSSKSAALAPQSMSWTTSDTRYKLAGLSGTQELSPTDSLIPDDLILEERPATLKPIWTIPSSTVSDVENNWATVLVLAYETPAENSLLAKTGDMTNFLNCKGSSPALSISKMKVASYLDFGLELLMPEFGYGYLSEIVLRRADFQKHTIAEKDFKNLHSSDFEDLNQLLLQGHLDQLPVVFSVNNNKRKIMRFNEIYKFSDGTLTRILEALAYRVKEFKIKRLNLGTPSSMCQTISNIDAHVEGEQFHELKQRENCTKIPTMYLCYQSYKDGKVKESSRKGQNQIKTGQKQEAWRSREKFKAVTVDKGRKTEQNKKRMAENAYTYQKLFKFKERQKEKGPELQYCQSYKRGAISANM